VERDTSPDAMSAQIEAARQLGCEGRLCVAVAMSDDARQISIDGVKRRHPEFSDARARHAVLCALYCISVTPICAPRMFRFVRGSEFQPASEVTDRPPS
jgi:hypothetical protein